jgi:hypothetical protein
MMDTPFYVVRSVEVIGRFESAITSFAVKRVGDGTVCSCASSVYAYKIVELLNEDARCRESARPSTRSAPASG